MSAETRRVIPEVNPAANIAADDEDEHSDLLHDGLGDDEGGNPDKHSVFDNLDPSTQPMNSDGDPVAPKHIALRGHCPNGSKTSSMQGPRNRRLGGMMISTVIP